MRRLIGMPCVVTGAARGIGLAIAERLAVEGGKVALWDISERRLEPAVQALRDRGLPVVGIACDVSDRAAVADAMARSAALLDGPVGVLVNNAVWARFVALEALDSDLVDRMLAVGLKAALWTTQAAVQQMRVRGGGSIVNLSSTTAYRPVALSAAYAAMKAGVMGLTRALAMELAADRIRVNTVIPGMVGTPASRAQFDEVTLARREAAMPLGRFGTPAEIAAAVAFLASEDGGYVHGAELVVDGGWTVPSH